MIFIIDICSPVIIRLFNSSPNDSGKKIHPNYEFSFNGQGNNRKHYSESEVEMKLTNDKEKRRKICEIEKKAKLNRAKEIFN